MDTDLIARGGGARAVSALSLYGADALELFSSWPVGGERFTFSYELAANQRHGAAMITPRSVHRGPTRRVCFHNSLPAPLHIRRRFDRSQQPTYHRSRYPSRASNHFRSFPKLQHTSRSLPAGSTH